MRRPAAVDVMLLATVLIWALGVTVTRYVLTHGWQPLAFSAVRYSAGALLFSVFALSREGSLRVGSRRDLALLAAAAALGVWLNQVAFVYAVKLTTATTVALILGTIPIFTAIVAFAAGVERLPTRFWVAAAISFGGVGLVALGTRSAVKADLVGDACAVATAATWAAYSVLIAPLMRRYSPYRISAIVLLAGLVPLLASGVGQLSRQDFSLGWLTWAALAFAIVGPLFVTNILWFTAIDRVGPSRATLFVNMQPFFAAVFALLLLSETLTWVQALGGLAIGAAIWLGRTPREVPPAAPAE
jgi:drug/metabolite transporter (DMT)-like permease